MLTTTLELGLLLHEGLNLGLEVYLLGLGPVES